MLTIKTVSPEQTYALGQNLAKKIKAGIVICLEGDLGAGKTLFVQGITAGLNVQDEVTSPTFSLMNIYRGDYTVYHFDLYRLDSADELENIGFYEYSQMEDDVVIIEWPDKFVEDLPDDHLWIKIERGQAENERLICISAKGCSVHDFFEELKGIC